MSERLGLTSRGSFLKILAAAVLVTVLAAGCDMAATRKSASMDEQMAVAAKLGPSLVRVEYTMKFDKGEPPASGEGFFREERPVEVPGFLVSPTQVLTPDRIDYPRFIESVTVRLGDDVVKAHVAAFAADHQAYLLELDRPLKDSKPLAVDASKDGPYLAVTCGEGAGAWTTQTQRFSPQMLWTETGRMYCPAPGAALITDEKGVPVGMSFDGELPADDSWKGSPLAWKLYTVAEREQLLKKADEGVARVTLHFRSPAKETNILSRYASSNESDNVTEMNVPGILLADNRVLVLASLRPKITARLETITVHSGEAQATAKFAGSLRDYGALVATLDKPLPGVVALATNPLFDYAFKLLPAADFRLMGEDRVAYLGHRRIRSFRLGWHRQVCPTVVGRDDTLFLFDTNGALVAMPIARREKVSVQERYAASRPELLFTSYFKDVLNNLAANVDPANVPLSEQAEHRLAWLGAELQPLNRDLARENKVSELTRDGATGAIVSYVYPNSPAAKAGVEAGWILLRLIIEGQPKPLDVQAEDTSGLTFRWERLDSVPEQMFDQIPSPWPSAETNMARTLTDLGFGKKFTAEFFHDGKIVSKDLVVTESPVTFDSAPRVKSAALGLTVRDLTYEVRRYFQKKDDEPGVIISKVDPGGKASVAGVKPYEIITHVNDTPVMNVKDFEKAVAVPQDELRLSIKRMTQGRVVKIKMTAAPTGEEKPAAEKPATEKPVAEKPATEKPAAEKPATEKPAATPTK
jgi:serine protease Do